MKIYIFKNIIGNYCSGDYYFCAQDLDEAQAEANSFANNHNVSVDNNPNYIIEWDEEPEEVDLRSGFLPLNRVMLPMKK